MSNSLAGLADEDIVAMVRATIDIFESHYTNIEPMTAMASAAAALFLVKMANDTQSDVNVMLQGFCMEGVESDWLISVSRNADFSTVKLGEHVLAGKLNPNKIQQAIDAFDVITHISVGKSLDG